MTVMRSASFLELGGFPNHQTMGYCRFSALLWPSLPAAIRPSESTRTAQVISWWVSFQCPLLKIFFFHHASLYAWRKPFLHCRLYLGWKQKSVKSLPKCFVSFLGYWPPKAQLFPEPKVIPCHCPEIWSTESHLVMGHCVLGFGKEMGKKWFCTFSWTSSQQQKKSYRQRLVIRWMLFCCVVFFFNVFLTGLQWAQTVLPIDL